MGVREKTPESIENPAPSGAGGRPPCGGRGLKQYHGVDQQKVH